MAAKGESELHVQAARFARLPPEPRRRDVLDADEHAVAGARPKESAMMLASLVVIGCLVGYLPVAPRGSRGQARA